MNQRLFSYNFNILLSGVFVKAIGTGIYSIAGMLLVLYISGDPFYSGVAFFVISLPSCISFLISPFANYVSYKKALIVCELAKSMLLFLIPLLYAFSVLQVSYVIMIMFSVALISAFTYPIETTLVPSFVGKANVVKANSYINTLRESLDIVFLAVAGVLVAVIGSVQAVLITACCHAITSLLYLLFRFEANKVTNDSDTYKTKILIQSYKKDLKAGIEYIRHSILPHIIVSAVFVNFFVGGMFASLPAFSLMQGGSEAFYGYFMVAMTLGMLGGSILTPRIKQLPYGSLTMVSALWAGLFWLGATLLPAWFSIVFYGIGFIAVGVINILLFSIIQQQVEVKMIGRVITVLTSFAAIGQPVGALLGGTISSMFSPVYPFILSGMIMVLFSLYWLLHPILRSLKPIDKLTLFTPSAEKQAQ
ncbi:MFS transporter [Alteribacter populi]|uniref:MFS transporter n=1 Tax=Alteribacter populi TaxID=2011011 RepID=UPI000BBA9BD9|nr:MFS transporter [Alteribacter populi]